MHRKYSNTSTDNVRARGRNRQHRRSGDHLVIFHMRASSDQQVPDGRHKAGQVRAEFLVVLLRVHRDVLTDLRLHLFHQTRLLAILQPTPDSLRHPFSGALSRTTRVSQNQKHKTNLDLTEARDSECQWHQLSHTQVCTSLHASSPPLSFLQAGCRSCRPVNGVRALK